VPAKKKKLSRGAVLRRYDKSYRSDLVAAANETLDGRESEFARLLAEVLLVDAGVLAGTNLPGKAERDAIATRVRAAWRAYHDADRNERKQRALVAALDFARMEDPRDAHSVVSQMRHVDRRFAAQIPPNVLAAAASALSVWPPKRGAPKKVDRGGKSRWDLVNELFKAFGCGFTDGETLRVHLSDAGIYRAKKP